MITTTKQTLVHLRWLTHPDLPEVLTIDGVWEEETFLTMLRNNNTIGFVAEHRNAIVGFMLYSLYRQHIELLRFKVHEGHRRRTVGRQMMKKLKTKLCTNRRKCITFTVSENNLELHLFLQQEGFTATHIVPQRFAEDEDGYRFEFQHKPPETEREEDP